MINGGRKSASPISTSTLFRNPQDKQEIDSLAVFNSLSNNEPKHPRTRLEKLKGERGPTNSRSRLRLVSIASTPKVSSVWPPWVITNLQPNSFDLCRLRRYVRWKMKTMLGHKLVRCVSCIFGLDDGDEDRWSWLIKSLRRILMKTEPLPNHEFSSRFCFRFLLLSVDLPLLLHFFFRFSSSVFCYCWEMVLSCHVVGSMGDGKERLDLGMGSVFEKILFGVFCRTEFWMKLWR